MNIIIACVIGGGSLAGGRGNMWARSSARCRSRCSTTSSISSRSTSTSRAELGLVLLAVVVMDGYLNLRKQRMLERNRHMLAEERWQQILGMVNSQNVVSVWS